MPIVAAARRIEQMNGRKGAFAAPRRRDAAEAADGNGARGKPVVGECAEYRIKRDAMAAGND